MTVDIDGTYLRYACMNEFMNVSQRGKIFTPQDGRDTLIEAVARIYKISATLKG